MIKFFKDLFKFISLSNPDNWELGSKSDWSYEQDYTRTPRKHYKHKKYPYFITNAYTKEPFEINRLVSLFIFDYKEGLLLDNRRCFIRSN